jgi:branched-subunit amino acid transport protein AzlD
MMPATLSQALGLTFAMGGAIFFCRFFPFLLFRDRKGPSAGEEPPAGRTRAFLAFVQGAAPAVAMTVLTFNAAAAPIRENPGAAIPVLTASVCTALLHLWKGNPLISIFGGTLLYMVLT